MRVHPEDTSVKVTINRHRKGGTETLRMSNVSWRVMEKTRKKKKKKTQMKVKNTKVYKILCNFLLVKRTQEDYTRRLITTG